MSRVSSPPKSRRLNVRSLTVLVIVLAAAVTGLVALKTYRDRRATPALLAEAKQRWEARQHSLALGYLNRYLELHPNHLDALDLKARFLAESAQDATQAKEAMPVHQQVLGRDPDRQPTRRRLIELNLQVPGMASAAVTLSRELIRRGDTSPRAHRLLARSLEQLAAEGDDRALTEACREYETSLQGDPGDIEGSERLAQIYQGKMNHPEQGRQILDRLLEKCPPLPAKRAEVRLARARYFARLGPEASDETERELAEATGDAPDHPEVRLAAAQVALQRGDTVAARRHLAALPEGVRDDLRVKLLLGMVDLKERQPDEAIQVWRSGLIQNGGNNVELTWRLAQVLLETGRIDEADPLMSQYRRLIGGAEPNAWYRYLHALSLSKRGRPDEAIKELEAIQLQTDRFLEPAYYLLLGQCQESVRDEEKAIAAFRKATEVARGQADPWLAIARLQWPRQPDAAIETLELGLKAAPGDPRLLAVLIHDQWERQIRRPEAERSWTEVERTLQQADQLAPGAAEVALARSEYLLSLNRGDETLNLLKKATEKNPRIAALWDLRVRTLNRLGRDDEALRVLDEATAATAAGPQAVFATDRAAILIARGRTREAFATLREALDRVPVEQRPGLCRALGEYHAAQGDWAGARVAYQEFAQLDPHNPEPHILLLDLALTTNDEPAIQSEVAALQAFEGPNRLYGRLARVQELLREPATGSKAAPVDPAASASQLDEAAGLIAAIKKDVPRSPLGFLLEGKLHERRHETDPAVAAYEQAVDRGGGRFALPLLVALLAREHRDADLKRLRQKFAALPVELERLAALQALQAGEKDRAEQLAAELAQGRPEALDVQVWQAQVLKALGKPEAAEAALRRLTEHRPESALPWIQLLMLQVGQDRIADAAATIEKMRAHVKVDRPELLWAQCYRVVGDLLRAENYYREALKNWPDDVAVRASAISFCEQTGRQGEAEQMLRKILARDPGLSWATRKLAILLASRVNDRAAWDEALRLIGPEAKPDDTPDDRLTRAQVYAQGSEVGHRREALEILEKLAVEQPSSGAVQELMARVLLAGGDLAQAREHAARAAEGNAAADSVAFYIRLLILAGDLDAAQEQLKRLEAYDPHSLPVLELRARLLTARGHAPEAAEQIERAAAERLKTVRDVPTGDTMIRLLIELKQSEAATRVARRTGTLGTRGKCLLAEYLAQRGDSNHEAPALLQAAADASDVRGAANVALGLAVRDPTDARWLDLADRLLNQARQAAPDANELVEKQALLRHVQGRYLDELALYEALLDRKPDNFQFLNNLAWTLSENLNRPDEGRRWADEAVKKLGPEPHVLDTRGVILLRLGQTDGAIRDLERAVEALPTGPVYFHLARAYQKANRSQDYQNARHRAQTARLTPAQLQPSERGDWAAVMGAEK